MEGVHWVQHPLVQHKLSLLRDRRRASGEFRRLVRELSMLLAYEVTRDLPLTTERIETPLEPFDAPKIEGKKLVLAPILRAGIALAEGMQELIPSARFAHIGLYRDHDTLEAVEYFFKAPKDLPDRLVIVTDPMLATGNSAVAAIDRLKARGAREIRYVCLLAAPEGIRHLRASHPDVPIWTAAIDRGLNEKGYIMPGLGDAGDRIYGTS
ncbi:MAG: uracil phosphoribosyltransferase [Beijerinckiaceae bacterium]|nr:uracil phosphoribosyltransferase [Beijerinckiaceae bacterium]